VTETELPVHLVVRTVEDADRLREAAGNAQSAVVAGGGWIAAETAASLRELGLVVTLVVPGAEMLERHLGAELGHELSALHDRHGVRIVRSSRVTGLSEAGGRRHVALATGQTLDTDLAAGGVAPASPNRMTSAQRGGKRTPRPGGLSLGGCDPFYPLDKVWV